MATSDNDNRSVRDGRLEIGIPFQVGLQISCHVQLMQPRTQWILMAPSPG
jgi:hypothetical protein